MEPSSQDRDNAPVEPDLSRLLPRLPAETQAQFDAVSALLVVNVSKAAFLDAFVRWTKNPRDSDSQLISAINHETYHYFQTIAAGFPFQYTADMVRIITTRRNHLHRLRQYLRRLGWRAWARLVGGVKYRARMAAWANALQEQQRLAELERRGAASGAPSLLGAMTPQLYPALEKLDAAARARNSQGLSARDLIEGSAVVYQYALTFGRQDLEARLDAAWEDYDDTYRRAYDFARPISGSRTIDVILPSIALALRYANPAEAFPFFVSRLTSSPPGGEIAAARALVHQAPNVPRAGRYLGTAMDVRKSRPSAYGFYDPALNDLSSKAWGIDELDLLADPAASRKVSSYLFGFVTSDGTLFGGSREDITNRLVLGGIAFRSQSLTKYVREAERRLMEQVVGRPADGR